MISKETGKELLTLARNSIESYFEGKELNNNEFKEKHGVFVTLLSLDGDLRGCIGYAESWFSLSEAVTKAARQAAFNDPRFEPLRKNEKFKLVVSVLTTPELIKVNSPLEYPKNIAIGKDGLIVSTNETHGLLLPGVAKEHNWNAEEFLSQTCLKAGLLEETWKQGTCKVLKFTSQVFKE